MIRGDHAALQRDASRIRPVTLAHERLLPVPAPLVSLFADGGLRRGSTMAIDTGPAMVSLALALAGGAARAGGWTALIEAPPASFGLSAVTEMGVPLERLAVIHADDEQWAGAVAGCVDAIDVVVARPPRRLRPVDVRRLTARTRERGGILLLVGDVDVPLDLRLTVVSAQWVGLGSGHGRLLRRHVMVQATGRRAGGGERRVVLELPGPDGGPATVDTPIVDAGRVDTARVEHSLIPRHRPHEEAG